MKATGIFDLRSELDKLWINFGRGHKKWEHNFEEFKKLNTFQQRAELKKCYDIMEPFIIQRKGKYVDPYILDWSSYLNSNEFDVFCACRCLGCPLYPQFPVGNYCLDMANPYFKVGLEIDSKSFHEREKDIARDLDLFKKGWTIYHLASKEAYCMSKDNQKDVEKYDRYYEYGKWFEERKEYYSTTIFGILECIYFVSLGGFIPDKFQTIAEQVAYKHRLVDIDGDVIESNNFCG